MRFQQGDAIFILSKSWFPRTIALTSNSRYSHVGLVIEDGDGDKVKIIESKPFLKLAIRCFSLQNEVCDCYRLRGNHSQELKLAVEYAKQKIGLKYNYLQFANLYFHVNFNKKRALPQNKKLVCTSLIDLCYYHSGIKRKDDVDIGNVTLEELLIKYDFERVAES
jgi:uncharacterized protein YycO